MDTDDLLNVAIGGNVKSVLAIAEHRRLRPDLLLVNLKGIHRWEVRTRHSQRMMHGLEELEQQDLENQHLIWRRNIKSLVQEPVRRLGPSCRPIK